MQHTSNYHLPQWEAGDRIKRADCNGAMSAIDAALAGAARIAAGTWVGDGTYGTAHPTKLTFSFVPKLILLFQNPQSAIAAGNDGNNTKLIWGVTTSLRVESYPDCVVSYAGNTVSWCATGNNAHAAQQMNTNNREYGYVAIG